MLERITMDREAQEKEWERGRAGEGAKIILLMQAKIFLDARNQYDKDWIPRFTRAVQA